MLGEQRRIERGCAGASGERVHAAAQRNHFSLRRPAGKLQKDGGAAGRKRLHHERQVKTDQTADEIS